MIYLSSKSHLTGIARTLAVFLFASTLTLDPLVTAPADANGLGPSTYLDGACNIGDSDPANHLTPETAFVIDTVDKLWEVTDCSSTSSTVYFRIDRDLDASDANYAPTSSPIGFSTSGVSSFSGVLNGGGFAISASMDTNEGVGLFALLQDAEIKNLILQGSYSTSTTDNNSSYYAGALAVRGDGHVTISSVANQAGLSGFHEVGGLIGRASGSVSLLDVENSGVIQGGSFRVGGLIGYAIGDVSINSSRNAATVSALGSYVGGFVGQSSGAAEISDSENRSQVLGKINNGGGFVGGASELLVLSSTNSGKVTGNGTGGDNNNFGGFVGIVTSGATLNNSQNLGAILSTKPHVGGVIGKADGPITVSFVVNSGAVSGTTYVGGLIGRSVNASLTNAENSGTVSGSAAPSSTYTYVGGLLGFGQGEVAIEQSNNSGTISGYDAVGGLLGFSAGLLSISVSFNVGQVTGDYNQIGGLAGWSSNNAYISNSYNAGTISGNYDVGGLIGLGGIGGCSNCSQNLAQSYNSGNLSSQIGDAPIVSRLFNSTATATSVFATRESSYASASSVASLRLQSTFVGWDFEDTWGFGNCSYNDGLPLLRFAAEVSQYESTACFHVLSFDSAGGSFVAGTTFTTSGTVGSSPTQPVRSGFDFSGWSQTPSGTAVSFPFTPSGQSDITLYAIWRSNEPGNPESSAPAPVYSGPLLNSGQSVVAGQEVSFPGRRLGSVDSAFAGNTNLTVVSAADEVLVLDVPANLTAGVYDLVIHSSQGTLTFQNGLTVEAASTELIEPEAATRLTVGSIKGHVAIYTKGYEGAKLSAKIAGKWLVVEELKESWKTFNYSRTVRFTGAGYSIKVHLYINGEFVRTEELTTK